MSHVEITFDYRPGEISFLQNRACKPRPSAIPAREHLKLKVFPLHTEKVYCIAVNATDAYATVSFLARITGKTANISQLTMRLPYAVILRFCCYKTRYFVGPNIGGMHGFTNSSSLQWSLFTRHH